MTCLMTIMAKTQLTKPGSNNDTVFKLKDTLDKQIQCKN